MRLPPRDRCLRGKIWIALAMSEMQQVESRLLVDLPITATAILRWRETLASGSCCRRYVVTADNIHH